MNCVVMCKCPVGELGDRLVEPLTQPGRTPSRPMEIEDRRPDFFDDCLQVVDVLGEPLFHFGRPRPRDGPLQGKPDREQALDDVVVKISSNTVTVGQDIEFTLQALRGRQLPGERCLVGEGGHHLFSDLG